MEDLDKNLHLRMTQSVLSGDDDYAIGEVLHAISDDQSSAFALIQGTSGPFPAPSIARFTVNESGQVEQLWSRRCGFQRIVLFYAEHSCWRASFLAFFLCLLRPAEHMLYTYLVYHVYCLCIYTQLYTYLASHPQ